MILQYSISNEDRNMHLRVLPEKLNRDSSKVVHSIKKHLQISVSASKESMKLGGDLLQHTGWKLRSQKDTHHQWVTPLTKFCSSQKTRRKQVVLEILTSSFLIHNYAFFLMYSKIFDAQLFSTQNINKYKTGYQDIPFPKLSPKYDMKFKVSHTRVSYSLPRGGEWVCMLANQEQWWICEWHWCTCLIHLVIIMQSCTTPLVLI